MLPQQRKEGRGAPQHLLVREGAYSRRAAAVSLLPAPCTASLPRARAQQRRQHASPTDRGGEVGEQVALARGHAREALRP